MTAKMTRKILTITPQYLKREARAKAKRKAEHLQGEMAAGLLYVARGRRRPKGWALAHNHILHSKNASNGANGFRYFWLAPGHGWSVCKCGWRPDLGTHYSGRPRQKCVKCMRFVATLEELGERR